MDKFRHVDSQESKGLEFFFGDQSINIMYPKENYLFPIARHERKTKSLPRTKFVLIEHNKTKGWNSFFLKTKASISCILVGSTHFSLSVAKRN